MNRKALHLREKTDEIEVISEPESSKRMRLTRFEVPTVPQTIGQLFSFGSEIANELGLRLKKLNGTKTSSK